MGVGTACLPSPLSSEPAEDWFQKVGSESRSSSLECIGKCGWVFLQPERASQAFLLDVVAEADLGCPSFSRSLETQELVRLTMPSNFVPIVPTQKKNSEQKKPIYFTF